MNNTRKKFYNKLALLSGTKNNRKTTKGRKRQYIYGNNGELLKTIIHCS